MGKLVVMLSEIEEKQAAVDIIENQFREKVQQSVCFKSVLQHINQHPGKINAGTGQQCDGQYCDFLVKKNENGKQQNAHGYTEITGGNIQIDLRKKNDENAERQNLLSSGGLYHRIATFHFDLRPQ